jgi:enoyl-CoA hydratase
MSIPVGSVNCWPLGAVPRLDAALPDHMFALTIRRDQYGPPARAVRLDTVPVPRLRVTEANRVLVAVLASGPNFNTNFAALGLPVPVFGKGDPAALHIPGSDALGIVVDAGAAVTRARIGDAVLLDSWTGDRIRGYETHDGFNAQFAVVDEQRAIPMTGALRDQSPERLAALLLTYGTAYRAVVERLRVRPGDSVLIMGGGKGTSFAAAQLAKALGARVILVGSNVTLMNGLVARGVADAFVDRRAIPREVFGVIPCGLPHAEWQRRTAPFRDAVLAANGGRGVDRVFEHTGGENFPVLVSALAPAGAVAFFGATGSGIKGEYKQTFFHDGRRFVLDARWVWMRQKQVLFRRGAAADVFEEIGLPPGRAVLVWGGDRRAREYVAAARARSATVAVIVSRTRDQEGLAALRALGVGDEEIVDRDAFALPEDMPDPLTAEGGPNPAYASEYLSHARALGKALWRVFGGRRSPDVVVESADDNVLHFSTFVARDFDERDLRPSSFVIVPSASDLSIHGSHMYNDRQARDVVRLLGSGALTMEQDDLDITDLPGLPAMQQRMLDGTMPKPKGVALVQADRAGRSIAEYEAAFLGTSVVAADEAPDQSITVRVLDGVALVTLTRPDTLNALNASLVAQLAAVVDELSASATIRRHRVRAVVLTGAGRAFAAGADVKEFRGTADAIEAFAWQNIATFSKLESLAVPVVALIDGFALGGGNELAMSAHYRIATQNARFGQPEVKLGIIPGYGGLQRLPRLVGPAMAAQLCINGEPIDGEQAVAVGLADEFAPSATALRRAFEAARDMADASRAFVRRDWAAIASRQRPAVDELLVRGDVQQLLASATPSPAEAHDLRAARAAAARDVLRAIEYGYTHGFEPGLRNDARLFGAIAASSGGQEWIGRFLEKDPLQASMLTLLPDPGAAIPSVAHVIAR